MAGMGLFEKFRSAWSENARLMEKLAELTGRCEALTERLKRHADMCSYPAIAQDVRQVAERVARHERELRSILLDHGRWPKPPEPAAREGANNWERLSGDLAILLMFAQELRPYALKWEGPDPALAARLTQIATEADESGIDLRKVTLKCDPMAID